MEQLKKEVEDLLAKHLPAQANEWLKNRLIEAENMEKTITALKVTNSGQQSRITSLEEKVRTLESLQYNAEKLEEKRKELEAKENKLAVNIAEYKLEQALFRAADMKEIVALVFKSPVYREAYLHNVYSGQDERGNYQTKGTYPLETIKSTE